MKIAIVPCRELCLRTDRDKVRRSGIYQHVIPSHRVDYALKGLLSPVPDELLELHYYQTARIPESMKANLQAGFSAILECNLKFSDLTIRGDG